VPDALQLLREQLDGLQLTFHIVLNLEWLA
jgi:hypothetical protein